MYNGIDPRTYIASHKLHDPDQPSLHIALHEDASHLHIEAIKTEISSFLKQKTWHLVDRSCVPEVNKVLKRDLGIKIETARRWYSF